MTFEKITEKLKGRYFDYEIYIKNSDAKTCKKYKGGIFCRQEINKYYLMNYIRYSLFCKSNHLHNMYTKDEWKEIYCSNKKLLLLIIDEDILKVC